MGGTFILSLDCEGKWGMADGLTPHHDRWLTTIRLRAAYAQLLDLFDEYDIAATFAFVMAFLLSDREQRDRDALFQDQEIGGRNWLASYRSAQRDGNLEGWCMPELLDTVGTRGRHEIGCHGFSHLPLGETMVSREVARREIAAAVEVAGERGIHLDTFIYPRNLVGWSDLLGEAGFIGYRDRLGGRNGLVGKAANLLAELNIAERPQRSGRIDRGVAVIPSGYFFNWRRGARRLVPPAVTERRWAAMLDRAAHDGGVVHLWLHPHNLISAPATLAVLRTVLRHVARRRDAGTVAIQTQRDFVVDPRAHHRESRHEP